MAARRSALKLHKLDLLTCPTPAVFGFANIRQRIKSMKLPFFTIGHSTRSIDEFVHLLRVAEVTLVADIRSVPRSRTNPQYNKDVLPATLATYGIDYVHIAQLGGLRSKSKAIADATNGFWENRSFQNYADYALTPAFQEGLDQLLALGAKQRCAMMCAEAVWWRCHRRIVTDHLLARDEQVFHLMNTDTMAPASFNTAAVVKDGLISYPASQ